MIIHDERTHPDWQEMEVAPNGLSGLGFSFAENFRYQTTSENQQVISSGNVVGLHNCCYSVNWKYPIKFFIIIFKPAGAFRLLRANMGELKNNLVNLDAIGLKDSEWICDNLRNRPIHKDKIDFMESWLERKLAGNRFALGITAGLAQTIVERNGAVAIGDLCKEFNVNKKYFERHFLLELGTTPKEFAGIVRFNYLDNLLRQKTISWKELAYLGNFHDQSHLIKHFQRLTGLTPGAFKSKLEDQPPEVKFVNQHNVHDLIIGNELILGNSALAGSF